MIKKFLKKGRIGLTSNICQKRANSRSVDIPEKSFRKNVDPHIVRGHTKREIESSEKDRPYMTTELHVCKILGGREPDQERVQSDGRAE